VLLNHPSYSVEKSEKIKFIFKDGGLIASTPANAAMMSSPMSHGGQQARIDALGNSTNNEQKLSKRVKNLTH